MADKIEAIIAMERLRFEAHAVKNWCHAEDLKRGKLVGYVEPELNQAWRGWLARALAQGEPREARLQQECDTITELNHAQWLALGKASLLVAACNRLSAEAEEFDFDDGLGRGAQQAFWDEFESALEHASEAIDEANKTTHRIHTTASAPAAEREPISDEDITEGCERHGITVWGPRAEDFQAGVRWAELVIANPPDGIGTKEPAP